MSNHNGNISLFLSSILVAANPSAILFSGKSILTTFYFYYIWTAYLIIYFTSQIARQSQARAQNYNETHVSGVVTGLLLGLMLRGRFIPK